jgi:hypothetical protein
MINITDKYDWLIYLKWPEEYEESPGKCIDTHWSEILDIIEEDRWKRAIRISDYYESENIDCSADEEYRKIKSFDEYVWDDDEW